MSSFELEIEKPNYSKLDYCTAFVDGTVINGKWGGGYVVFDPDGNIIWQDCGMGIDHPELNAMRNISGEMSAAMHATLWIDKFVGRGTIVHDYIGLSKWVTGEWNTQKQYTKMYADFMKPFYVLDIIKFKWVKGHTGVLGNEIADRLASQSVRHKEKWKFE